jgi:hypothetical protein
VNSDTHEPYLMQATSEREPVADLELRPAENPDPNGTLGDIGLAAEVVGLEEFVLTILNQPFDSRDLAGVDATSVRVFRWDGQARVLRPVWFGPQRQFRA